MARNILGPEPTLAEASNVTLAKINAIIDGLGDDWQKQVLTNWRDHYWAEVVGDLDAIMETLAPNPVYRTYGWLASEGSDTTEAAHAMYAGLIGMGYRPAGPLSDMKFAFADWGLMAEFTLTAIYPGAILAGVDADPDAAYRVTFKIMESHPYGPDGLMGGETVFMSAPSEVVRIER